MQHPRGAEVIQVGEYGIIWGYILGVIPRDFLQTKRVPAPTKLGPASISPS